MDWSVELKKHVLPVLRRPLYFGFASRGWDVAVGVLEDEEAVERARRSDLEAALGSLTDAEGVYGWRREAAYRPGLSMSL